MNDSSENSGDGSGDGFRIRALSEEELVAHVEMDQEKTRGLLGVPTKTDFEQSDDSRIKAIQCTPMTTAENFRARSEGAKVLLVAAYATGAMPNVIVPVIKERISQGVVVVVVSDNPGDSHHGIIVPRYLAGMGAYDAGAIPLQTVNIKDHGVVKMLISSALNDGIEGAQLVLHLKDKFFYKNERDIPKPAWERPEEIDKQRALTRQALKRSGFEGEELEKELHKWGFGEYPD